MVSTIFYPFFFIGCSLYTYFGNKYKQYNKNFLVGILVILFCFIVGVRVDFGADQKTYLEIYYTQGPVLHRCEPIFVLINQLFRSINAPYQLYFAFIAFLQILFLIFSFEKEEVNIFWGFLFFYFTQFVRFVSMLRQGIAMSIVLLAIYYFLNRKYLKWIILVCIAAGFHKSAFICFLVLPFLSVIRKIRIPNFIYYLLLISLILLYEQMYDIILNGLLLPVNLLLGGSSIIKQFIFYKTPLGSGLGVRIRILAYVCMLPKLLEQRKLSEKDQLLFLIFYLGIFGEFVASLNMNLQRVFLYFSYVQVLWIPKVIQNLNKTAISKLELKSVLFLVGLFCLVFIGLYEQLQGANGTEMYQWSLNFDLLNNHSFF